MGCNSGSISHVAGANSKAACRLVRDYPLRIGAPPSCDPFSGGPLNLPTSHLRLVRKVVLPVAQRLRAHPGGQAAACWCDPWPASSLIPAFPGEELLPQHSGAFPLQNERGVWQRPDPVQKEMWAKFEGHDYDQSDKADLRISLCINGASQAFVAARMIPARWFRASDATVWLVISRFQSQAVVFALVPPDFE